MNVTTEQIHIASEINARVHELDRPGATDISIFVAMSDLMPAFQQLVTISGHSGMSELCSKFSGLYRYSKILEHMADGVATGVIKVP